MESLGRSQTASGGQEVVQRRFDARDLPPSIGVGSWVPWHHWYLSSVGIPVTMIKFLELSICPEAAELQRGGVSHVELLIMFETFTTSRLRVVTSLVKRVRSGLTLVNPPVFRAGVSPIWMTRRFGEAIMRALSSLPRDLGRSVQSPLDANHRG